MSKDSLSKPAGRNGEKRRLILLGALAAVVIWILFQAQPQPVAHNSNEPPSANARSHKSCQPLSPKKVNPVVAVHTSELPPTKPNYSTLTNVPMRLTKKILVSKKWNNGADAFGLDTPPKGKEGATIGPAAVTFFQGSLYLLDTANKRILKFDTSGNLLSSVELPNNVATDLSVDASGTALILIDHMNNHVYKVDGSQLVLLSSVPLRENFPLGTKFSYDPATDTLTTQEVHQDGLADIDGKNLVLNLKDGAKLALPFDRPVACVEEVVTDATGVIWVLYTLEGDYQMRRVARVDRSQGTVGTAEVDVYFAFDATRHMTATGNGIVLFGGDNNEGRLISFNYAGNAF